jgi:tRNA A37 threonylcarbamoyladenosine biosynthesis protein TsaE
MQILNERMIESMKTIMMVLTLCLVASMYTLLISEAQATTLEIHEVTYEDHNGNKIHTDHYITGADISDVEAPEAPVRQGYLFIGWSYELPTEMPDADIVIHANYMLVEVRVTNTI